MYGSVDVSAFDFQQPPNDTTIEMAKAYALEAAAGAKKRNRVRGCSEHYRNMQDCYPTVDCPACRNRAKSLLEENHIIYVVEIVAVQKTGQHSLTDVHVVTPMLCRCEKEKKNSN